jgi:hypothetical protein
MLVHTTDSKVVSLMENGFYPWDGLSIRGNNSSVAAKGCRRDLLRNFCVVCVYTS